MARILIIEDESTISMVLTEVLKEEGHEAKSASNGTIGLTELKQSSYDVVLADLLMPGMGGKAVVEFMRSDPQLDSIPVVIITGAVPCVEDFPPEGSYQAFIRKPFDLNDVVRTINRLVKPV